MLKKFLYKIYYIYFKDIIWLKFDKLRTYTVLTLFLSLFFVLFLYTIDKIFLTIIGFLFSFNF